MRGQAMSGQAMRDQATSDQAMRGQAMRGQLCAASYESPLPLRWAGRSIPFFTQRGLHQPRLVTRRPPRLGYRRLSPSQAHSASSEPSSETSGVGASSASGPSSPHSPIFQKTRS